MLPMLSLPNLLPLLLVYWLLQMHAAVCRLFSRYSLYGWGRSEAYAHTLCESMKVCEEVPC